MSELLRRVAIGAAASVISGALVVLIGQPVEAAIVDAVRAVPGLAAPVGDWIEAHRAVVVLASASAGVLLALVFAVVVELRDGGLLVPIAGGVLGGFAGESIVGWTRGAVADGPVLLALVGVMAAVAAVLSARGARRQNAMHVDAARARALVGDRARHRLPPVQIAPMQDPPAIRYERFRRERPVDGAQRRATPPAA